VAISSFSHHEDCNYQDHHDQCGDAGSADNSGKHIPALSKEITGQSNYDRPQNGSG